MEIIYSIINSKLFPITVAIFIGIAIGYTLINPILIRIEKNSRRKGKKYRAHFIKTLGKLSPVFGITILLNLLNFYQIDELVQSTFTTTLTVLNAVILTHLLAEVLVFIYDKYSHKVYENKASTLFHVIIRILVYIAGIFAISSLFDYDITALLTAMGVGGLAIALALQETLSNLFAGMQILTSKQLRPGDYIKIETDVEGYVLDINWRNTIIKTLMENVIIIPNSKISSSITTNYFTLQKNLYFHVHLGVHYDSDLELVEKVTFEVAQEVLNKYPNVPKDFKPRVRFYEFADSSINLKVWMATDLYENQYAIRHHFIKALQARYNKEGIVIPFPIRTVYMQTEE